MRKGIMFSFIMIFITVSILSLIAIQNSLISHRREEIFIEMRVNSINDMYDSLIKDMDKSLKIISRRAISVAFSNVSVSEGGKPPKPLNEANETLAELIRYGTLEGTPESLMENATFTDWINKIKELSILKGFETDVDIISIQVKPYDYLHIHVKAEIKINISDKQGVAEINRSVDVNSIVSLEGLEDPLYPLNTNGLGSNIIRRSPYIGIYTQLLLIGSGGYPYVYGNTTNDTSNFNGKILITHDISGISGLSNALGVIFEIPNATPIYIPYLINSSVLSVIKNDMNVLLDGDERKVWFIDNLIDDHENSYYHPSDTGPSYLDRLEGKLTLQNKYKSQTNNTIGLECFVNKLDLYFTGISINQEKTNIDYIYFSNNTPSSYKVKGLNLIVPDLYFRIDNQNGHHQIYNVSDLITS